MARAYSQGGRRTLVVLREAPDPWAGWVVTAAAHPLFCPVCDGSRVVQLRVSAEPPVARGGRFSCPLCSRGAGPGRAPIAAVTPPAWRDETPRSAA